MSKDDMQQELERLRAEVAALSKAKQEGKPLPGEESADSDSAQSENNQSFGDELKSQMEEMIELLETEIREQPAMTALVIFSLGILMGRFLR